MAVVLALRVAMVLADVRIPDVVDRACCAIGEVRGGSAEAQPRFRKAEEPRAMTPTGTSSEAEVSSASAAIREYGLAGGRAQYVSHQVDPGGRALKVYRVRGGDFDAAVRRLVPIEIRLRFLDAAHSRAERADARQRLWTLPLAEQIRSVSIRWDGPAVVLVVVDDVAAAQARYDRALPGLVEVEGRREEQR